MGRLCPVLLFALRAAPARLFLLLLAVSAFAAQDITINFSARVVSITSFGDAYTDFIARFGLVPVSGPTGTEVPFTGSYTYEYPQTDQQPGSQGGFYGLKQFRISGIVIPLQSGSIRIFACGTCGAQQDYYWVVISEAGSTGLTNLELLVYLPAGTLTDALPVNIDFHAAGVGFLAPGSSFRYSTRRQDGTSNGVNGQTLWSSASVAVSAPQITGKLLGNPAPQQSDTLPVCLGPAASEVSTGRPGCVARGNPIALGPGNKFQMVADYQTATVNRLGLTRYYNSSINSGPVTLASTLGRNWRGSYDRYIHIESLSSLVLVERPDGRVLNFTPNGGVWRTDTDVDLKLVQTGSTWTLTDLNDTSETYTAINTSQAILTSIRSRNGYTQSLQHSGGQLASVTDSFGRSLQFTYQDGLLRTVTTPDSVVITYGYTASAGTLDRLSTVSYSTTPVTSQTYLYEDPSFPFALTGILDENGNRFATWTYDSSGRATSSQHAGGAEFTQIAYNPDGSRTVTNALGRQEVYTFATLQGVPKVTQISRLATATTAAATRTFTYDANGYKSSETDWNGNLTTYVNDSRGLPTSITEASGTSQSRTRTIAYDGIFHLPTKIIEPGITTDLAYDANGNLLTRTFTDTTTTTVPYSTNGTKRTWTYTWGSFGLVASAKGPRTDVNQTTSFAYDGSGTLIRTTNALGQQSQVTQHTPGGLPQTHVDANNVTTQLTYDARLRLSTSTVNTATGARTTAYGYDPAGNLVSVTLPDGSKLTNSYDPAHRLTGVTDLFNQVTAYTLDALGNRTQMDVKNASNAVKRTVSSAFDALGRRVQDTGGAAQVTKYAYDSNGNLLTITDPLNRITQQAFDPLNRLFRVTDPAAGIAVTTFDAHDRPLSVTAPNGAVTSYVYNGFGDLIQETSPDRGKTVYRYDPAGNLTQVVDARNIVQNHSYDALDRRSATAYPGGASENITYRYDEAGHGFGVGRLTSLTDEAGTLSRSYDERGNLLGETRVRGAVTKTTSYTYDAASRIASITYPSGAIAAYARDAMGRTAGVTVKPAGAPSPLPVASNVTYQPFGPMASLTFGNGAAGTRAFDLDYRLTNLTDGGIQNLTYGYNAADNVLTIADGVTAASSQSFGYDPLDRLTSASGVYGSFSWTYDSVGNRLTQQAGGVTTNYTYTPQSNRLTQVRTGSATQILSYTPAGSITTLANVPSTRPATGIAYNQAGRLARVLAGGQQTLAYSYDAFGRRVAKAGAGGATTLYQYDQGGHLLEESNGQGVATTDYLYLGDQPIATFTPGSGTLAFLHTDRLGTPQKATNGVSAVVWRADYEPFGGVNAASSQTAGFSQSLRLPGQEFEVETGWHQNGFRDYAPGWGRYLESDPIGLAGGINTFGYVRANPVASVDSLGLNDSIGLLQALFPAHTSQFSRNPIGGSSRAQIEYASAINSLRAPGPYVWTQERSDALQCISTCTVKKQIPDFFLTFSKRRFLRSVEQIAPDMVRMCNRITPAVSSVLLFNDALECAETCGFSFESPTKFDTAPSNAWNQPGGCGDTWCLMYK